MHLFTSQKVSSTHSKLSLQTVRRGKFFPARFGNVAKSYCITDTGAIYFPRATHPWPGLPFCHPPLGYCCFAVQNAARNTAPKRYMGPFFGKVKFTLKCSGKYDAHSFYKIKTALSMEEQRSNTAALPSGKRTGCL